MKIWKWLYPGMKIKRWILLCAVALIFIGVGSSGLLSGESGFLIALGGGITFIGIIMVVVAIKNMLKSLIAPLVTKRADNNLVDIVYRTRHLEKGPRIVVVGGGTGLSVLLHGIKEFTSNITAIVTVADDGGSSGRLRNEFDVLPPGDIRNCLVALADAEPLMRDLFQFRFKNGTELEGHNFGNLFITAMSQVTGDFEKAIRESSKILSIRGRVLPSTLENIKLVATYKDGSSKTGETNIVNENISGIDKIRLEPVDCKPTEEAIEAISQAEAIVLGPGSLYTSVIPNLLIDGIRQAILLSPAIKIYICNVMTQPGETDNFTTFDHLNAIVQHTSSRIVDYCVANKAVVPPDLLTKYEKENAFPVMIEREKTEEFICTVIEEDIIDTQDYVRHNSDKLGKIIINLIINSRYGYIRKNSNHQK